MASKMTPFTFLRNKLISVHKPYQHDISLYRFLTTKPNNTKVNFSPSDSDSDSDKNDPKTDTPHHYKYNPFRDKPTSEDPKDLQKIFHNMRTEGLFDSAAKMFDGLSKAGLTHEALDLFGRIKDRREMPDVVSHTAVIEAYADAGRAKEALKAFRRMLACGVAPNAYTYAVLIKGLVKDDKLVGEAGRYVREMMEKGMRPNVEVCVAVVEGLVRGERDEEARELVWRIRDKGFVPEERDVREVLKGKRGGLVSSVVGILFGKS